jgi:hypothetical protein
MGVKMTFREYLGQDAQNPPTGVKKDPVPEQDRARLQTYINNGQLSDQDVQDLKKMLTSGYRFDDALTRALEQANRRKYLTTRQPNG